MQKEGQEGLQIDLKAIKKRTAAATGVSEITVRRIEAAVKASDGNDIAAFRTPGKKRAGKRRITGVDSFDQGAIKRCVHNFHNTEKALPTITTLLKKLKQDINFRGSASSLRRILKRLGFKWHKTDTEKKVLIENSNIRLRRIEYLERLSKYRAEGRPIIFTGESYIDSSHTKNDTSNDCSSNIAKGQRVVIVHAASDMGFVHDALLFCKGALKSGDYRSDISYDDYKMWIKTQLMPNIPPKSVIVVGNANYHCKVENAAPVSTAKKAEMQLWLTERNIPYSDTMLKPQLYKLITLHKDQYKKYELDSILKHGNHTVLRLPPDHPDLNPVEIAWTAIKEYVAKKSISWNINNAMELVKQKVNLMGQEEWCIFCRQVMTLEEEYKIKDLVIDSLTEEMTIHMSDENESESEMEVETESEEEDSRSSSEEEILS